MRTFTVHLPRGAEPGDRAALTEAEFVKDGFVWGAFVFSFLWFFWHRLWVAGLIVLVAVLGLSALLPALGVDRVTAGVAEFLLAILIGLEANSLRRWTYARRGRPAVDVVTADSEDEAVLKGVARALAGRSNPPLQTAGARFPAMGISPRSGMEPVLGLFPDPEIRR
jgi:hypothetical protein